MKWKHVLIVIYSVVIAILMVSVIHSGYSYLFDPDELFHINVVFLLTHNLVPYRDIFIAYTPFLSWFLMPISYLTGFTFHFLEAARAAMIVLFIIRLILIFIIARKLFGSLVAYICIPLSLFDAFTVFSGMQVRPDNLMMTLYIAGILLVLHWYLNIKKSALLWAGFLLGVSAVTLVKNIPATFFITFFILIELVKARNYREMTRFMVAMVLPVVSFALWAWYKGIFPSMIQMIVFDAKQLNDSLRFPENILNYYWPPNFVLYGFPGRPITWVYELCLPLLAFAGMFTAFLNLNAFGTKRRLVGWFTAACLLQWISLLFVRSVFLQYFLSVSWFLALFAAYTLVRAYKTIGVNKICTHIATFTGILILLVGLVASWKANNTRALNSYAAQKAYIEAQWHVISESAVVFPGTLFRVSIYPLGYEVHFVDFSRKLIERYGSPSVYLARYRIPYVVIDPYNFSFLDAQTQTYIKAHYRQDLQDQNMWTLRN
jgi:4-amino-4-deoxy-L-arabinose transferase-like glycosyltransferase